MHSSRTAAWFALGMLVIASGSAAADEKPKLTPYGFVRLDVIFDDSRMQSVNSASWVESEGPANQDDKELSLHPRLTRLGMKLDPADVGSGFRASGQIEVDFQNGGSESREALRMRHGFVQLAHGGFELLGGQTWDLVSPLYPAANSDAMMWNAGNPGDRRPQLRMTMRPKVGGGKARLAIAAGMPNAINNQDLDSNGQLDGLDAAVPTTQVLAEIEGAHVLAGVWGHIAQDRVSVAGNQHNFTGELVGGHLRIMPGSKITIQGEGFWGQNGTDVRVGIGQGINLAADDVIRTAGGWAEMGVKVSPRYDVTFGGSIDQPHENDLADGARRQNTALYLVQHWKPLDHTSIGLEYLRWNTLYVNRGAGRANRVNAHLTYSF